MTDNWYKLSKEVILIIAKLNKEKADLDAINLFIDFKNCRLETSETDNPPTLKDAQLFGTLGQIDPSRLLVEKDAESEFVIDCLADIIESASDLTEDN